MYRLINYPNHPLEVPTWALGEGFSNYNIDEFVQKWTFGDRKPFFSTFSHISTFLYSKFQMIAQIYTIPLQNMLSQVISSKIGSKHFEVLLHNTPMWNGASKKFWIFSNCRNCSTPPNFLIFEVHQHDVPQ
jgi:hypothetical protein